MRRHAHPKRGPTTRLLLSALLAAMLTAAPAAAQSAGGGGRPGGWLPVVAGVRLGAPLKLSAYAGPVLVRDSQDTGYSGVSLVVEPGLGGGQVAVGTHALGGPLIMFRAQVALLRTWGDPWGPAPGQTFVGAEALGGLALAGFSLGAYLRVQGDAPGDWGLLSLGILVGI